MRGHGPANVGVPQGSPLSPVVFLILKVPILRKVEERVREGINLDMEMPSFVNDKSADIIDWDGGNNMQQVEVEVNSIVREVAGENNLPLETEKEEVLHRQKHRKKNNVDRKYVQWLGVISMTPWILTFIGCPALLKPGRRCEP